MAITLELNAHTFRQAFINMDRGNQFSYAGFEALYEHLEEMSDDTGEDMHLDVIAICCEYSEHDAGSLINEYGDLLERDDGMDDDEYIEELVCELESNTTVIEFENSQGDTRYLLESF